jgi:hypothetical protein
MARVSRVVPGPGGIGREHVLIVAETVPDISLSCLSAPNQALVRLLE